MAPVLIVLVSATFFFEQNKTKPSLPALEREKGLPKPFEKADVCGRESAQQQANTNLAMKFLLQTDGGA